MINFETFQALSFTLAGSLFIYLAFGLVAWFCSELKPKKPLRGIVLNNQK